MGAFRPVGLVLFVRQTGRRLRRQNKLHRSSGARNSGRVFSNAIWARLCSAMQARSAAEHHDLRYADSLQRLNFQDGICSR